MARTPSPRQIRQASVPAASVLPPAKAAKASCQVAPSPILDAAERVAMRDGVGHVTLDAVAKEAGLSKSGLIHHYPSKDALIGAMVLRKINAWGNACDASIDRRAGEPGGATRGLIEACFECPDGDGGAGASDKEDSRNRGCVVIAALVHDAKHIDPVRKVHRRIDAKIARDGLPPGLADVVHLALNGMWFNWVFNLSELTPQRLELVRSVLEFLIDHPELLAASKGTGPVRTRVPAAKPRSRKRVST